MEKPKEPPILIGHLTMKGRTFPAISVPKGRQVPDSYRHALTQKDSTVYVSSSAYDEFASMRTDHFRQHLEMPVMVFSGVKDE